MKRKVVALGLSILTLLSFANPASAITFGREVTNAADAYPSVVSIWYSETAEEDAQFICTGTLIQPRIVLTAAHCVLSTGLYYVQYGADQLFDEMDLLPVSATWKNPRYSAKQMVNDTGLLLLENEIVGAQVTRLPSSAEIKKIQATKGVKYEIVGWGKDQNDEPATYLRRASVDDQTAFMKKLRGWRNDVWFAVGKWNSKEKVFAGSCNGDSGGPLFATASGKKILSGITSWGAEDCEKSVPSVYVRLSYYIDTLVNTGIPTLYTNEMKQNRAMPTVISEPKISGDAKVNSTLTCGTGLWSSNTKEVKTKWSTNAGWTFTDASNPRLSLGGSVASDTVLTCTVTGSNNVGTVERTTSVTLLGKPTYSGYLSITGIDSYTMPKANTEAKCSGVIWGKNPATTSYKWMIDGVANALSTSPSLILTGEMLKNYGGKKLTCIYSATNNGGTSDASTYLTLPTLKKPSEPLIDVTYFSPYSQIPVGTVLDCNATRYSSGIAFDSISYKWGYRKKSDNSSTPDAYLVNGSKLTLDAATLALISDKTIYCYVTVSNLAGEETYFASRDVAIQIPPVPVTKVTSTVLTFSGGIDSIKVGDVITCAVSTSGSEVSRVRFVWRNSNIAADVSYSAGFREITFIDELTTQTTMKLTVTSSVLQNIQGLYLDCLAYVEFKTGPNVNGYTKVKIPTPTATPTPTPTATVVAPSQPVITGVVASLTSLTISWNPPSSTGGSPVTQYWAYVENIGGTTIGSCTTTGALTCTVTGLSQNTDYKVIVSAWNSDGGVNRSSGDQNSPRTSASTLAAPVRATLSNPDLTNNNTEARYTSSLAPQTIFGTVTTSKSLGVSPCSDPCSGLLVGDSVVLSRRIQTATNPGSVTFIISNPSRAQTDLVPATLTSGTYLDGIWTATWIVSQTIKDNPWNSNTQLKWGSEYATS